MSRSISVIVALCASTAPALPPSSATKQFLINHEDSKAKIDGTKVVALYGPSLGSDSNQATSTQDFVEAWMADADNADALGVDGLSTELAGSQACGGNLQCFTYTQMIEDLPVHGSTIKALIRTGSTDRMAHVGARIIANPGSALPSDVYSAAQAESAIESAYPDIDTFDTATKVVYQSDDGDYHRAWRLYGWDSDGEVEQHLFFVDTSTNNVVGAVSAVAYADVNGTVSGFYTPCCSREDPEYPACCGAHSSENPPLTAALPGLKVRVLDQTGTECAVPEGAGEQYTCMSNPSCGEDGSFEFLDVPGNYDMVTSSLTGQWVRVHDCDGRHLASCPGDAHYSVVPRPLACAQIPPYSDIELGFPSADPTEQQVALVNVFLYVSQTHDWVKSILTDLEEVDVVLPAAANSTLGPRNALYSPGLGLGFSASGMDEWTDRPYRNTAMATVVAHEYGHFVQDALHGWANIEGLSWREGTADIIAALVFNSEFIAQGVIDDADLPPDENFWRRLDEPDVQLTAPYNDPPWCLADSNDTLGGHCRGLALGGAFWDLRESLLHCANSPSTPCTTDDDCSGSTCTDETTERIFADYLCCAVPTMDSSVLPAVLSVDDDDNDDISDGTEHSAEILAAFAKHGWTNNPSEVEVAWVGPVDNPVPIEGTDYIVDYQCDPPCITLITTEKTENGQPVAVERWIIGRVDQSTSTPLDIGRIDAAWDGTAHNVTIQVGSDPQVSAIHQCANVHIVNPSRESASHWTSLDLQLAGSLIGLAEAFPTGTSGGRVRGTIAGSAAQIDGYAVGIGENQAGTLSVGAELTALNVTVLPDTAGGPSKIEAGSIGSVFVDGNIDGDVVIRGDSAGNLLANADEIGSGNLAGEVTANRGDFNGNICGDNLASWQPTDPIPSNLNVIWGPSGTICGNIVCPAASAPDSPQEEPSGTNKNRYISFVVPQGVGDDIAIRVRLRSLNNGAPDFVPFQGQVRYLNELIDPDTQQPDYACDETAAGGESTFKCATLGCELQYRDWEALGEGDVWHVKSDTTVPDSIYDVEIIRRGDTDGAQCPSVVRIEVRTGPWGDANCDGDANVLDIPDIVDILKSNNIGEQILHAQADLADDSRPDEAISVLSISSVVDAIKSIPYEPNSPPLECP